LYNKDGLICRRIRSQSAEIQLKEPNPFFSVTDDSAAFGKRRVTSHIEKRSGSSVFPCPFPLFHWDGMVLFPFFFLHRDLILTQRMKGLPT
jgi:hypothetical protein